MINSPEEAFRRRARIAWRIIAVLIALEIVYTAIAGVIIYMAFVQ